MDRSRRSRWVLIFLVLLGLATLATVLGTRPKPDVQAPASSPWREVGRSEEGRPIEAATFGSGSTRILVLAGVHGNELGPDFARDFGSRLSSGELVLPPGVTVYVVPEINPDGRIAQSRGNSNGVDINRNMPTSRWRSTLSPKDSSGKQGLTGGTAPSSEAETAVLLNYLKDGVTKVVTLHSQGGFVDWDGDRAKPLAKKVSAAMDLPLKHVPYQKHINGSLGQYAKEHAELSVITVELSPAVSNDSVLAGIMAVIR